MVGGKTVGSADTGPRNTVIPQVIYHMFKLSTWTRWMIQGLGEDDFPRLKGLEGKYMANLGCLHSMDRVHGTNVKDDAKPKQRWGD